MEHIEAISSFYKDYYSSIDFKKWQNKLSNAIYLSLRSSSKEIPVVIELCKAISDKKHNCFKKLSIESKKIHGWNMSGVKFYQGKKELGDMVIVSVITLNGTITLLKTAFIQNKVQKLNSWEIDQKQLYLLKNFPTFIGASGIFNKGIFKDKEITFLNNSGTLGNYGLFTSTGDMIFLTARNVFCNQSSKGKDKRTITFDNIKKAAASSVHLGDIVDSFCPYYKHNCCCIKFNAEERTALLAGRNNSPFFNNYSYALDVHEVVKQLTYFNIGENIFGQTPEDYLYSYTMDLLTEFKCSIDKKGKLKRNLKNNDNQPNRDQDNNDITDEGGTYVILNYLEL